MKKLVEYCLKSAKSALILIFLPLVGVAFVAYFTTQVSATSSTINFQGKIVRNDVGNEGLNVSAGSPTCVFLGPSNDTCDFRIKYYSADTLGTLLATEVFSNIEIGEYNGIFNLALGTGSFTGGSETSFRNMFLNNSAVYVEMDFAPNGTTYTETFLNPDGKRMAVRAAAYAISAQGSSQQFQFDIANDASGYSNISAGQVFYDGSNNVLRLYDGANWLAIQASIGNLPSYWLLNEATTPDIIYSYTGLDVAFGGSDASSPFFYDVSGELLTLTNTTSGLSFRVNDQAGDTTPFAIDASGNVGIGTDAPSAKLEVTGGRTILESLGESQTLGIGRTDGAGLYWLGVNASSTPALSFLNNSGVERFRISDNGGLVQIGANDTSIALSLRKATVDATHIEWNFSNVANNKDMTISGYNGTTAYTFMSFDWDNQVSNFETGRVGIGVINPNGFLGIRAATASRSQINFVSSAGIDPSVPTNGDMWWNGTNLYFFDGSSSVDLLAGGGSGGSLFTDGGATTYLTSITDNLAIGGTGSTSPFFFNVSEQLLTLTNTTSGLSFRVNDEAGDTTPFVIDASGNVGIGTATPGGKLEVAGVSSVISNTAGDITFDSASGNISFAGDSLINVMNGTFAGNVVLTGGQLQLGNHVTNPTAVGEGAVVYNSTDKILYYNNGTTWAEVGKVYTGTTGQMLRHDGTDWVASSVLVNDGTNVTVSGQLRVGNYGSKPAGIGEGSLVYDTTIGSLFVYDGTDWKAISTSQMSSTTGVVSDGSYLELIHGENSFDLISSAWVKVGSQWVQASDKSNAVIHDFDNEFAARAKEKKKVSDVKINYNENDLGTGSDGSIVVSSNTSINSTSLISGRSCADGGDAVNYSVTALTSTTATLESSPSAGCISVGDEVLLINLQGTTSAFVNTGNYETLRVASVGGSTITFSTSKTKYYGNGSSDDTNIGLGSGNQTVMLQRVPNYANVTVNASINFLADAWVSPTGAVNNGAGEGGVLFFRSTGTVSVGGTIHANALGYIGGVGGTVDNSGGAGGESFCGLGGGSSTGAGINGAAGGGAGNGSGGDGTCGGGGGRQGGTGIGGIGSVSSGGSGGGGANRAGGGGGGYGSAGTGGTPNGLDGGTNQSGDGGTNSTGSGAGGGGGTFGDADLNKLYFGAAGGGGGRSVTVSGAGGRGGGIVYVAGNLVTVSGAIRSNAANGTASGCGTGQYGGGGAGGAGGSVKLVGNTLTLGSSLVTASAGTGANGCNTGTPSFPGGNGGVGRVAVYYSTSISGTTAPTYSSSTLSYNNYASYISNEVHTPNSTSYGNILWSESLPANTEIQLQTRSGATPDSTDGTWEAWKPTTSSVVIQSANTHTDFTGTNATVADGDVTRNVDYYEDEDETTVGNLTKITSTAANGYANSTISATNLSTYTYITAWVRSSVAGNVVKLGFGESAATENERVFSIDTIDTWQKIYWDISGIAGASRDAVTQFRITLTQNSVVGYIDNVKAESYLTTPAGSSITSTANEYIQYRAILTTLDVANTPVLSNIKVVYTNPDGTYTIDANRVRSQSDRNYYDSERIAISEYDLSDLNTSRTLVGPNQVTQSAQSEYGDGSDGSIVVSSNTSINSTSLISGRSCADGGDAVNYSVTALTSTTATLESSPSAGCISVGDEVLLINLQGTTSAFVNTGNYETLRVASVGGSTITFSTSKTKYYGNGSSDDTNIGLGSGNQTVMLQRVPNYANVTVNASINFLADAWVSPTGAVNNGAGEGGVLFFRSTGTVSVGGTIHANALGYIGGVGGTVDNSGGAGGESFCGLGGGSSTGAGINGAAGGGAGNGSGGDGTCGGGGGRQGGTGIGGIGSVSSGGSGGGGANRAGGGGGGYGSAGTGGTPNGLDGGTNQSGDGGTNGTGSGGGGGGGTFGDADLNKLYFGAAGGGGGRSVTVSGAGGRGGGIVYVAGNLVTVSGAIRSNAANGTASGCGSGQYGGGGAGGAGGSVKLVGNTLTLGSSLVTASAGSGANGCNNGSVNFAGGNGGVGRVAVYYSTSISGTAAPAASLAEIPSYNYGYFISDEIATPNATSYGNLKWNLDTQRYGTVQLQTRSGASDNSTDGSWEAWKPVVTDVNNKVLNSMDTHTDFTGTNATVADGDVTRDVDYHEDEDESTAGNLTKITSTAANGYAQRTISSTDLSNYEYIAFWVRAQSTGNIVKMGFGESSATENEKTFHIDSTNTWQKIYWDISGIDKSLRNAVTSLRITVIPNSTVVYIDNIEADRYMRNSDGTTISSTPNEYIQYRAVFTTTNESFRPVLYNVQFTWSSGYKLEMVDANTIRLYNHSGESQELKINVTGASGSAGGGSNWVSSGGNVYRASGFVGIGDSTPDVELKVVGALCVKANADDCAGATAGTIYANNTSVQSADLAEMYKVSDLTIEAGDIVSLDPNAIAEVQKSSLDNIENVMGVVSTAPGLLMNDSRDDNSRPIGLIGKLPVKVMTTGRSITKGDVITASTIPGIGVMRDDSGMVVAKALEETYDWNEDTCTSVDNISEIVWPIDDGRNESKPCFKVMVDSFGSDIRDSMMIKYNLTLMDSVYIGKIMAFVDVVWYQPQWISDDMAKIISDYNNGILGGNGGGWTYDDGALKTDKEVSVGSISGNTLSFNILSGGVLNIGNGNLVADSGGNLSLAGDLILGGRLKSNNGSIVLEIGAGETDLFAIHNSQGEVVFSVDGKGKVGGKGVYRSEWVRVESNSSVRVSHNFGVTPSNISIIKADNMQGYGFTSKGLGSEFYYEYYDSNSIEVYNTTNNVIYVKLTLEK